MGILNLCLFQYSHWDTTGCFKEKAFLVTESSALTYSSQAFQGHLEHSEGASLHLHSSAMITKDQTNHKNKNKNQRGRGKKGKHVNDSLRKWQVRNKWGNVNSSRITQLRNAEGRAEHDASSLGFNHFPLTRPIHSRYSRGTINLNTQWVLLQTKPHCSTQS